MQHLGDICMINGSEIEPVDVIIGGSPCQDLSVAGKKAGLAGERSSLFMEQIRIIKEMRAADEARGRTAKFIRPRFMVWENVPGAFSSNKSEDFRTVLEETARIAQPDAVIPRPPKGKWRTSGCILGSRWSIAWRVLDAQFWGVPQRRRRIVLIADFGGHAAPEILFERKGLSWDVEPCRTTGKGSTRDIERGTYPAIARSLTARYDGSPCIDRGPNVIVQAGAYCLAGNMVDRHAVCAGFNYKASAKTGTICYLNERVPIIFRKGTRPHSKDEAQTWEQTEVSNTLNTFDVGEARAAELVVTSVARRFTPLECERLQGFPDGWTDIGAWRDSKGKLHKKSSDAARCRALGNSIALPPWRWVLLRLSGQFYRSATLGSLFDGIGGFPLIWESINGRGSCLWTSEVDEFCIAVTKRRFGEVE